MGRRHLHNLMYVRCTHACEHNLAPVIIPLRILLVLITEKELITNADRGPLRYVVLIKSLL